MRLIFVLLLTCSTLFYTQGLLAENFKIPHKEHGQLLDFDYTNFDAGTFYIAAASNPYFPFVNRTEHDVSIEEIIANNLGVDNPFQVIKFTKNKIIKPGERDTLFFARNSDNTYRIKAGYHDLSWTVTFKNSAVKQHLNIFCTLAENRGIIETDSVKLGTVGLGDTIQFSTYIKNAGTETVTIWPPKEYDFTKYLDEYPVNIAPHSERILKFEVNTATFPNRYDKSVILKSNDEKNEIISIPISGQVIAPNRPDIYFETTSQRLDVMEGGPGNFRFKYTNTGDMPLLISQCRSSCGCVVPSCKREPLAPGESEEIIVKYDTRRVGPFRKTVTVYSNAVTPLIVLRINGNVTRKPKVGEVPYNVETNQSAIQFFDSIKYVNYSYRQENEVLFQFYNSGKDSLKIIKALAWGNLEVKHPENAIAPGEKGWISAKYDTKIIGEFNRHITVISNGAPYTNILELTGLVRPEWDSVRHGAIMTFDRILIDTIFNYDADAICEFPFTNTGDQPLIISSAKSSVPVMDYPRHPILPGEHGVITVQYDSKRVGNFNFSCRLTSNDTKTGVSVLKIRGVVRSKPITPSHPKTSPSPIGPKITFESTLIQNEYVYNEDATVQFTFNNTGDEPLIIERVTVGDIAITDYSKGPIQPGEGGFITVEQSTKIAGPFHTKITIQHNDRTGNSTLYFTGSVGAKPDAYVPNGNQQLKFNTTQIEKNFESNEKIEITFNFTNSGSPLQITRVISNDDGKAVFPKNIILNGEQGVITCSYPNIKSGPFERTIVVEHSESEVPIILTFKGVIF